ncbi:hypothetical protein KIV56_17065 [Cryobacterium breve]|uniref:Restriction endonuclease n=1 Tax=Cryobacterium breve TaxID=1259258 RepID=A0ABY7NCY4_9MICO|nr:hypothetical protein [Cryobacterium breve]WBM79857.1 hypothetical protein KIV56_17065 [Cryobacterium breve]
MTVTIDQLEDLGLLFGPAASLLRADRQNDILAGVGQTPREAEVTAFMAASDGALEQALIRSFCQVWGIEPACGLRLISGKAFGKETGQTDHRSIDLVVKIAKDDDGRPISRPVIAIEAKFAAMVNGKWGYCPQHLGHTDRRYSNQIICYVNGCTNSLLDEGVGFVWLGLPSKVPGQPLWGKKAINPNDGLEDAFVEQTAATQRWRMLTWPSLFADVDNIAANSDVRDAVLRALGRGTRA